MDSIQLALSNIASPPVLAFILGLSLVLVRSQLQIPSQIFDFLSIYLLLAIGIKGGVSLSTTPAEEVWLPILVAIGVGCLIPVAVFYGLKTLTPLDRTNRGALAAHYGSTSLVTFTAGLVFLENAGLAVEGYMPSLLAVMEVPGIIVGILLAKKSSKDGALSTALNEVFTSKSVILLIGGILIGLATGPAGYEKVEPFFGEIFAGMLTIFLLQLGIQAGKSVKEARKGWLWVAGLCARFSTRRGCDWCEHRSRHRNQPGWFSCVWSAVRKRFVHSRSSCREAFITRCKTWPLHHYKPWYYIPYEPLYWDTVFDLVFRGNRISPKHL